jgi:hypothetical protein
MKCSEFRKNIVLLRELPEKQQEALTEHMQSCAECLQLYQESETFQRSVKTALSSREHPSDPSALTNRIMRSLADERIEKNIFGRLSFESVLPPLRLACALLSVSMIVFFLFEFRSGGTSAHTPMSVTTKGDVALDAKLSETFGEKWNRRSTAPATHLSFLQCLHECRKSQGRLCSDCLKSTTNN